MTFLALLGVHHSFAYTHMNDKGMGNFLSPSESNASRLEVP